MEHLWDKADKAWTAIQNRLSCLPETLHADSPLDCIRILKEVRLGFREVYGVDGQPCACGGLLRPKIEARSTFPRHQISLGVQCDRPECPVELVPDWQQDRCPRCGTWAERLEPTDRPAWTKPQQDVLWCSVCRHYLTIETI